MPSPDLQRNSCKAFGSKHLVNIWRYGFATHAHFLAVYFVTILPEPQITNHDTLLRCHDCSVTGAPHQTLLTSCSSQACRYAGTSEGRVLNQSLSAQCVRAAQSFGQFFVSGRVKMSTPHHVSGDAVISLPTSPSTFSNTQTPSARQQCALNPMFNAKRPHSLSEGVAISRTAHMSRMRSRCFRHM